MEHGPRKSGFLSLYYYPERWTKGHSFFSLWSAIAKVMVGDPHFRDQLLDVQKQKQHFTCVIYVTKFSLQSRMVT